MSTPTPRFWQIFFDVFESLPRQGPGNRTCAARALALCTNLPPAPVVLDLGCGVGGQTIHLAELTTGTIIAIDSHARSIERLTATAARLGLSQRISPAVGDMASLKLPPASFDLIWSEGALYNIGIEHALKICHRLLRPNGYLAFTDAVWRKQDPPPEVKTSFDLDYPAMGTVADVLAAITRCSFSLISHFTLPDEAWWDDFYTPMQNRIEEIRGRYADDNEALAILDQLAQEPAMHRKYADYYAYEFFVARARSETIEHRGSQKPARRRGSRSPERFFRSSPCAGFFFACHCLDCCSLIAICRLLTMRMLIGSKIPYGIQRKAL